jgi:RNA recognition motif-containing protein
MRIYVGNLSFNTDETQLEQLFAPLGTVESVHLVRDRESGRSRGFAFVEMRDDQGRAACEALDQKEFEGRRLTVNEARPQERRGGGNAGGRSGGGRSGGFGHPKREARW